VVASVWVGFDKRRPIMARATGGRVAAPIWARTMLRLYQKRKAPAEWGRPPGVIEGMVDPASGMLLASGCRPFEGTAYREVFVRGSAPQTVCPSQGQPVTLDPWELPPLPDFEEGMETGVPLDEIPLDEIALEEMDEMEVLPPGEDPLPVPTEDPASPAPPLSYAPSSPRPPSAEPAPPAAEPVEPPERRPSPSPVATPEPEPEIYGAASCTVVASSSMSRFSRPRVSKMPCETSATAVERPTSAGNWVSTTRKYGRRFPM
jgi:membrane peptidoglycan carboxypeptidase